MFSGMLVHIFVLYSFNAIVPKKFAIVVKLFISSTILYY